MTPSGEGRAPGGVTSVEVARAAGVSQSAVSRVFTPGASVSAETARKVRDAALRLGYRRNALARSLITGESKIIGLAVAELDNYLYPAALERLSERLRREGYHIMIFFAPSDGSGAENLVADLLDYQVDGLIAASVAMTAPLAERCRANGIPVMLFNRHQGEDGPPSVTSDNFAGGRLAGETLAGAGCRRIAHISGWQGSSTGRERQAGFLAALAAAGLEAAGCLDGCYCRETARAHALSLFSGSRRRPDALFVGSDHMAFAVMDALRCELGLRIPGDVSVIGFDDVPMASWPAYDLTTVRQPLERMVDETVSRLLSGIGEREGKPVQVRLQCEMQIRGSARLPGDKNDGKQ